MTSKTNNIINEELAFHKVAAMGFKVLLKNYECPVGEIDLIAKKDGKIVFFSINKKAGDKVKKVAAYYLKRYGIKDVPCEFQTVEVSAESPKQDSEKILKCSDEKGRVTRAGLMEKVRAMRVKNFRVMNKEELAAIVDGAPRAQVEAIQLAAVTRWKAGWSKNKKVVA